MDVFSALGGVVIGYALKILEAWLQDRRSSARERRARIHDFQRQTLIDLQDAMADLARACGEAHHEEFLAFKRSGRWGEFAGSNAISDRDYAARRKMLILCERVIDEQLRDLIGQFNAAAVRTGIPPTTSQAEADKTMLDLAAAFERANHRLGQVLRDLY